MLMPETEWLASIREGKWCTGDSIGAYRRSIEVTASVSDRWHSISCCVWNWYTYLLKHLIDVCEDCPVQVSILVGSKAIPKAALRHLKYSVFDSIELALDLWIVFREV